VAIVPLSGIVAVPQVIIINEQHARYLLPHDLPVHITHVSSQQPQQPQRQRRQIRRITARGR